MNAITNFRQRNTIEQPAKVLGDLLSADQSVRAVELAFIKRYSKAAHKASEATFKGALLRGHRASIGDELKARFTADLTLMRSPAFSKIARELEKNLPADASFGKFGANNRG